MATSHSSDTIAQDAGTIFSRILVGIDGSPESLEAAWQAAILGRPEAELHLLASWQVAPPVITPMSAGPPVLDGDEVAMRAAADAALAAAGAQFPSARPHLVRGVASQALLDVAREQQATLVAVGSHGRGRVEGIVFGSTATRIVHEAPCSVLVARGGRSRYPQRIAVGVDGSPASALAFAAAEDLAARFDAEIVVVVAEGEHPVDLAGVSLVVGDSFRVTPADPVRALTAAAADADLLVVGSRGLHGVRAVGSVSERVAHRAACSTLIVR